MNETNVEVVSEVVAPEVSVVVEEAPAAKKSRKAPAVKGKKGKSKPKAKKDRKKSPAKGGAPRRADSLRNIIRMTLVDMLLKGNWGTAAELAEVVAAEGYHPNTLAVQISQVRGEILTKLGLEIPGTRGRMSAESIATLQKKLALKSIKDKLAGMRTELKKAA